MPSKHINIPAFIAVTAVFTIEAVIHYNIGVHKDTTDNKKFVFPPATDFAKLFGVTLVFALLSGVLTASIEKAFTK